MARKKNRRQQLIQLLDDFRLGDIKSPEEGNALNALKEELQKNEEEPAPRKVRTSKKKEDATPAAEKPKLTIKKKESAEEIKANIEGSGVAVADEDQGFI